jgi:membrane dipeptidase
MIIVDAHQDIAYNALSWGRDYRIHPLNHRRYEISLGYPRAMIGLHDALLGRVGVIFGSIFTAPYSEKPSRVPYSRPMYKNASEAYRLGMQQLDYYQRLEDEHPQVRLIEVQADLEYVLTSWKPDTPMNQRVQGIVISFEGADPILEPKQFEEWYERGVRCVGLAWQDTRYCGGSGSSNGLTPLGFELLEFMAHYGAILDISHASEKASLQILDAYSAHIIASHSNPRRFSDTDRHLSDAVIRRLAERGGVMGVVMMNQFLSTRWSPMDIKTKPSISEVVDVIDYVCQLTGSAQHVGLGSDFDGGFGAESTPNGLDTVSDLYAIAQALASRGYSEVDVLAIMGENFLRVLRASLPV